MSCRIEFPGTGNAPVDLKEGDCLSEKLTIHNSPILFGCRIGICGTCAIEILEEKGGPLHARTDEEKNFLETMVPGEDNMRLACQIHLNTNISIKRKPI